MFIACVCSSVSVPTLGSPSSKPLSPPVNILGFDLTYSCHAVSLRMIVCSLHSPEAREKARRFPQPGQRFACCEFIDFHAIFNIDCLSAFKEAKVGTPDVDIVSA